MYSGDPVIVPKDIDLIIDCGYLIDTIPHSNFCMSWLKNGNAIITNSSCVKMSVDMRKLRISSNDSCIPGSPIVSDSYIILSNANVYECKISRATELDVDEETVNQANAGNEFYLGFFHNHYLYPCGVEKYPPVIWVTTLETTSVSFVISTHDRTIYVQWYGLP